MGVSSGLRTHLTTPRRPGSAFLGREAGARRRIGDVLERPDSHRPVFQPIYSLAIGRVVGFEAFSRFAAEPIRPPDQWFAEATRVGFGVELQAMAIRRILDVAAGVGLPGDVFLSLNVSPRYLSHPIIAAAFAAIEPRRLVIEITEEEPVADYRALREVMQPYLVRGVRFAIDDAGAGFASMRHITELQPAYVKLDADLVRGMGDRETLRAFLRALNGFATEIGAVLVAEGVETIADLTALIATGFPLLVQGYAIARPGPPWPSVSPAAHAAWREDTARRRAL